VEYLAFALGAMAILLMARMVYVRFERGDRSRRLRGARACLDAVDETLNNIAKTKSEVSGNPAQGAALTQT
jgi:hypothetical protein